MPPPKIRQRQARDGNREHHEVSGRRAYLRDTLAVLSSVQNRPGDPAGVLSLQEERLGLAILESEDLAVTSDVELTLQGKKTRQHSFPSFNDAKTANPVKELGRDAIRHRCPLPPSFTRMTCSNGIFRGSVPCQGRFSGPRRCRRRFSFRRWWFGTGLLRTCRCSRAGVPNAVQFLNIRDV
jgi:hypothetical protein